MSNLELSDDSDAVGNYTNEVGDRSDADNRGILFNDQIPGLHQSNQLADGDGTNTSPPGKRKFGTSDGGKQQKHLKEKNTSMEAENALMMDHCAREINDLNRERQTVEYLKEKCNEETAVIAELSMILINNGNENVTELRERIEQLESTRAQLRAGIAQLREL